MPDENSFRPKSGEEAPTARELATILFRQRAVFLTIFALVLAAVAFYVIAGNRYRSNMKILVHRGRIDAPVTGQANAPVDLARLEVTEEDLNSEVELLQDGDVLRKVVETAGLVDEGWMRFLRVREDASARSERAARRLASKLTVEPIRKTNLIAVTYASSDPASAARVLRALESTYVEKHTEVHRPTGEVPFFLTQVADAREQLDKANRRVLAFSQDHHVVTAERERDLTLERLSEIDASARQTKTQIAETRRRIQELHSQLSSLPERSTTQIRNADNPELLRALKSTLLDLELKRTQLLDKFEPAHRLVQEVDEQIAQTKSMIEAEKLTPVRDESTDLDPNYEWAKAELQHAEVQLHGLEARSASLAGELADYRGSAQSLGQEAVIQDDLQQTRKAAQDGYLLYLKKLQEARIDDAMDERGIVNVAIAEHPVAPALPTHSAAMLLALGILAAAGSGAGAAFAADYLDPSLRTPTEVQSCLNAPVLASLPRKKTPIPLDSWKEMS